MPYKETRPPRRLPWKRKEQVRHYECARPPVKTEHVRSFALLDAQHIKSRRPNLEVEAVKIPSALRLPSRNLPEPDKEYAVAPLELLSQRVVHQRRFH